MAIAAPNETQDNVEAPEIIRVKEKSEGLFGSARDKFLGQLDITTKNLLGWIQRQKKLFDQRVFLTFPLFDHT